jgi:hypothetical protein
MCLILMGSTRDTDADGTLSLTAFESGLWGQVLATADARLRKLGTGGDWGPCLDGCEARPQPPVKKT